jgi:hypothetical protein
MCLNAVTLLFVLFYVVNNDVFQMSKHCCCTYNKYTKNVDMHYKRMHNKVRKEKYIVQGQTSPSFAI